MNKYHGVINYDGYMMTDYKLLEGDVLEIRQFDIEEGAEDKLSDKVYITIDDIIKLADELKVKYRVDKKEDVNYEFGTDQAKLEEEYRNLVEKLNTMKDKA